MTHPILAYHELVKSMGSYQYAISEPDFADHLHFLYENDYSCIAVDEYHRYIRAKEALPSKILALTFDDGHESNVKIAFPALMKYGFKATFFITTGWIGRPGYMHENEIKALVREEMSVQSHGKTHSFLDEMKYDEICSELQQSRNTLEQITEREVRFLSLPGGRYNEHVIRCAADLGFAAVFSSVPFYFKRWGEIDLIGRYVLKYSSGKTDFHKVIRANRFGKLKYRIFNHSKKLIKCSLGNNLYHFLWKKYIGR